MARKLVIVPIVNSDSRNDISADQQLVNVLLQRRQPDLQPRPQHPMIAGKKHTVHNIIQQSYDKRSYENEISTRPTDVYLYTGQYT